MCVCVTEQSEPDVGACCLWQNIHKPGSQGCFAEPHHHCASSSHLTWTTESGSPEGGPLSPVCLPAKAQTCTVRCVFLLGSQTFVVTWNCMTSLPFPSEDFWQFLNFYHFCILGFTRIGGRLGWRDHVKLSQRLISGQDKGCGSSNKSFFCGCHRLVTGHLSLNLVIVWHIGPPFWIVKAEHFSYVFL